MSKRYFTVDEANELVPRLEAIFRRVLGLRAQLRSTAGTLSSLGEPLTEESVLREDGTPELATARAKARALVELLTEALAEVDRLGVEVKDLDIGLCDFVTRREGRDVYLCWQLGEKQIEHWHEIHAGYAGRRPLDAATPPRLLH